jgi:hypothetical protein
MQTVRCPHHIQAKGRENRARTRITLRTEAERERERSKPLPIFTSEGEISEKEE